MGKKYQSINTFLYLFCKFYWLCFTWILLAGWLPVCISQIPGCSHYPSLLNIAFSSVGNETIWSMCNYPNPTIDWDICNRPGPSYICDPDGLLTVEDADYLDTLLNKSIQTTKCRCKPENCISGQGHPMYIALVNRMSVLNSWGTICQKEDWCEDLYPKLDTRKREPTENELQSSTTRFANRLLRDWEVGTCQDELIIFYNKEFQMIGAGAGVRTKTKLGNRLKRIFEKGGPFILQGNLRKGFEVLIDKYTEVLANKTTWPMVVGILLAVVVGGLVVFGIAMTITFIIKEKRSGKTCLAIFSGLLGGTGAALFGNDRKESHMPSHELSNL